MTQILFGSSLKVLAWVRAHMRSARYSRSLIQLSCCCPLPLYDEARAFGSGGGSPWHFPNRNRSPCRDVSSSETLPEVPPRGNLPFGKTSATEAPLVGAWEAGDRCRCAQFEDIRLIGMLLGCLEGLPVWRVFCWKPLSSSVIMSLLQICTRHGSKASIQDGRTGKLKNLIKNFPSLICFCPIQPCRLHQLTAQSVSLTDTEPSSFAAATVCIC